jgi:hypothetical protein
LGEAVTQVTAGISWVREWRPRPTWAELLDFHIQIRRPASDSSPAELAAAILVIHRTREFAGSKLICRVFLDLVEVATLKIGDKQRIELRPGRHSVRTHMGKFWSSPLEVHLRAGETTAVTCGFKLRWTTGRSYLTQARS